ncbi:protoporphyrinogen oxidase [Microlunatus flavus]|uniref:Coproporphyrinogen III oxidase n=1 Tax=Microlunatus flavus TaxID=1036181 RepID=A0A1H9NH18_9ACTN|nr:protoporphyrinogen oxidase [Microlunatus flavus]SER35250.1 oxygen-dependent protoporphyrinogen oxidase [Microlunatus flavus]
MRAVVVGGGVSGLGAALRLRDAGLDVTVVEAGTRWGGKLAPVRVGDLVLDGGAESMLARRPEAVGLADALGLAARRTTPTTAKPRVLVEGEPRPIPPSLQGVPVDPAALRPLLTAGAAAYAEAEPDRPAPPLPNDLPIGAYVDERFGPEVTDRLLEPLLGGVYAGRSRTLSFASVAPALFAAARTGGSLAGHARASLRPGAGPVFAGLVGGVHALVDALVERLGQEGADLRLRTTATALRRVGTGVVVTTSAGAVEADVVVLAAPAPATSRLLAGVLPGTAALAALEDVPYASVAVVTMVVRGLAPADSGLLVPPGQLPTVKALTYSATKWGWVGDQVRAAYGDDVTALRVSVGRAGEAEVLQVDDETLVRRSLAEVSGLPGWEDAQLVDAAVSRWGGGLPQFRVGHVDLVDELRRELQGVPGVALAGAYLDGVGLPACLASADAAAEKVLSDLGGRIDVPHTTAAPAGER